MQNKGPATQADKNKGTNYKIHFLTLKKLSFKKKEKLNLAKKKPNSINFMMKKFLLN